jgi:glutathione S-transferase
MTEIIVHGVPGSPYVRSALLGLEEKARPYRLAAMGMGDARQAAHLERHPFGRIPVFEHDGFMLYETQAILRYLERVFPEPRLTPEDPRLAARMDQVMGIVDWYLFRDASATIGFNRVIAPMFGFPVDEAVVTASLPKAAVCFKELNRLLGDQGFMAGAEISLADLMVVPQLEFLAATPEGADLLKPYPRLTAWLARMLSQAA